MAPNKGTFGLRKWRCSKIDKLSAPAKRFLTTVESIVITLALIASLGIASPLMASGVEPSPEAAVGVIGQDEATGIDNDECVESEDGGDLECETTTAPGSASGDGAGSGSDSGDSANTGGAGTGGANGSIADSAGTGDESDVDDADADDAEAADTSDIAENDADKESGKDGDEKSEDADADKPDKDKEKASKAEATTDNTFEKDGGQLNLGYLFSRHSLITFEDADDLPHMVGPILVGGTVNENSGSGFSINNAKFYANSYVKGTGHDETQGLKIDNYQPINGGTHNNLYLGTTYQNANRPGTASDVNPPTEILYTDSYLDFEDMKNKAQEKSNNLAKEAFDLDLVIDYGYSDEHHTWITTCSVDKKYAEYAWCEQDGQNQRLVLKAGQSYSIDSQYISKFFGSRLSNIVIDTTGVTNLNGSEYDGENASTLPETIITITGNTTQEYGDRVVLPTVDTLRHNGEYRNLTPAESATGIPLVWNMPDATRILKLQSFGNHFGHVIAPNADAYTSGGNTNGCWMVASISGGAEGHLWPYNGKQLYPATTEFSAKKILKDAQGNEIPLGNYLFKFELWDVTKDSNPEHVDTPDKSKGHELLETVEASPIDGSIVFDTTPSYSAEGTHYYLIVEKVGSYDDVIYDTHVEHVTVTVTSSESSDGTHFKPSVSVKPLKKPQSKDASTGQVLTFVNQLKPKGKLTLTKEMESDSTAPDSTKFDFTVKLTDADDEPVSGTFGGVEFDANGTATVQLGAGESKELTDLPVGTKYEITEQETAGYELVTFGGACGTAQNGVVQTCTGTISDSDNGTGVTVTATNRQSKVELSLRKFVNNQDDVPSDLKQQKFNFNISLWKSNGDALTGSFNVTFKYQSDTRNATLECATQGTDNVSICATQLRHDETITIAGLPYNAKFSIKEVELPGGFQFVESGIDQQSKAMFKDVEGQITASSQVTVTNHYEVSVTLPSAGGRANPLMTAMFGLGIVFAGLLIAVIYARRSGFAPLQ